MYIFQYLYFRVFFTRVPQIVISDPAILKQVLVKEFHNFSERLVSAHCSNTI